MNRNYREGRRKNFHSIILPLFIQNVTILGLTELTPF